MAILPNPKFIRLYMKHNQTVDRLWKLSREELNQFQTERLHEMMEYAQKTTLYQDKFRQGQINKESIQTISDVRKIPFTTKQDLRDYGVKGTLPSDFDMEKGYKVDTSGSTGKPVSIYRDLNAIALEMTTTLRMMKSHNLAFKKTRISNIGDFTLANSYDIGIELIDRIVDPYGTKVIIFNDDYNECGKHPDRLTIREYVKGKAVRQTIIVYQRHDPWIKRLTQIK